MTTPEINLNVSQTSPTNYTLYFGGNVYGPYTGPLAVWRRDVVYKPESHSTPVPARGSPRLTSSWFRERRSYNSGALSSQHSYYWWPAGWYELHTGGGAINTALKPLRPWRWDLRGRSINGALANLKDQKIDLSVAFGERKECAELFYTNIKRVSELYSDLKKSKRGVWDYMKNFRVNPGESRISQVPKAWLETQYAVKPLVQDVFGAIDKLNGLERDINAYFFRTKKSIEENESGVRPDPEFCCYLGHVDKSLVVDYQVQERAHTSLIYRLANPLTRELSNLGITNPLSTAYELTTLSFVLDWALPVGDYLSALDADFGWQFLTGSTMLSQRATGRGQYFESGDNIPSFKILGDVTRIRYNNFSMFREVHTSSPWPVYPTFKNPLTNATRVTSALALLSQVFK